MSKRVMVKQSNTLTQHDFLCKKAPMRLTASKENTFVLKRIPKSIQDSLGKKRGILTIRKYVGTRRPKCGKMCHYVEVDCDCGTIGKWAPAHNVIFGKTQSCGCVSARLSAERNTKHGFTSKSNKGDKCIYDAWVNMHGRCENKHRWDYKHYGGRGIKVCRRWSGKNGLKNFKADIGERPSPKHSIDRINVNGGYCPSNIRWATLEQQRNNCRGNLFVVIEGERMTRTQAARKYGINQTTMESRFRLGWTVEEVYNLHPRKRKK